MGDFKPGDIYVGVVELFSVLLPGAFLVAGLLLALPAAYVEIFESLLASNGAQWVAFAFCAYAAGAFVFPVASLLDETYYRRYRERKGARGGDQAFERATALRCRHLKTPLAQARDDNPMNTFSWAKAVLMLQAPAAFSDVQRYEAESKFFRSLAVALPVVGVFALLRWAWAPETLSLALASPVLALVLAQLSLRRYAERRHKSTEWAYRYVIVLHPDLPAAPNQGPEAA